MIYLRNLLLNKLYHPNYTKLYLNLKMEFTTAIEAEETKARARLVLMLLSFIAHGDFLKSLCFITKYNLQLKTCTPLELKSIDNCIRECLKLKKKYRGFYYFYQELHLYDEKSGSLCLINRVPFTFGNGDIKRSFTAHHNARKYMRGYPDCIESDSSTRISKGWKLRNVVGRQNLPVLKFNCKYDIITSKENFAFYQERYPGCRVRDHALFATYAEDLLAKFLDLSLTTAHI